MKKKMTDSRKRALRLERKYLDRAILRLVHTLGRAQSMDDIQSRELIGLARARWRVT